MDKSWYKILIQTIERTVMNKTILERKIEHNWRL